MIKSQPDPNNNRVIIVEVGSVLEMGIPPNIAVLVSALRSNGFDVKVFSTNDYQLGVQTGDNVRVNTLQVPPAVGSKNTISTALPWQEMGKDFEKLLACRPLLVGFSTTEATYRFCETLLAISKLNGYFTIVGGAFPTLVPETVISNPDVDAICVGEGEGALVALCRHLSSGKIEYEMENLWFKVDDKIIKNPVRAVCDINRVPFQDWTPWKIPPRASKPMIGTINTTALIELSRGCPFNCTYCANSFLNKEFKGNYRERSVSRFIEEAAYLKKHYNIGFIYISDETIFTTTDARLKELSTKYRQTINLPFWCETRPESITTNRIGVLKDAGLKAINVGVESGNENFRKAVLNRHVADDIIIKKIRDAISCGGIRVGANVIIGFPGQTRNDIFDTIRLIREAQPSSTMVHLFQPYVKTPLRDECIRKGIIPGDYVCGDYRMDAIGTGEITAEEIMGLQRTFNLYVDMPINRWNEIEEAEHHNPAGNTAFARLAREYQMKHFNRTSFPSL